MPSLIIFRYLSSSRDQRPFSDRYLSFFTYIRLSELLFRRNLAPVKRPESTVWNRDIRVADYEFRNMSTCHREKTTADGIGIRLPRRRVVILSLWFTDEIILISHLELLSDVLYNIVQVLYFHIGKVQVIGENECSHRRVVLVSGCKSPKYLCNIFAYFVGNL